LPSTIKPKLRFASKSAQAGGALARGRSMEMPELMLKVPAQRAAKKKVKKAG
jgi:hypothetical protein